MFFPKDIQGFSHRSDKSNLSILAYLNVFKTSSWIISCTKHLLNSFCMHFDAFWALRANTRSGVQFFCLHFAHVLYGWVSRIFLTVTFSTNFEIICRVQNNKKTFYIREHCHIKQKKVNKRCLSLFIDLQPKITEFMGENLNWSINFVRIPKLLKK